MGLHDQGGSMMAMNIMTISIAAEVLRFRAVKGACPKSPM